MPELNESKSEKFIIDDTVYETQLTDKFKNRKTYAPPDPKKVISVIPGTIRELFVSVGSEVREGDKMLMLEAMKMKNLILAPMSGKIRSINVKIGEKVPKNQLMIVLE